MPKRTLTCPLDKAHGREVNWPNVSDLFKITRGMEGCRFVYVVAEENEGPIKIGVANDPIRRLRGMQTGNPRRLKIEYVLLGDMETEKLLHEFWEPFVIKAPEKRNKSVVDAAPGTEWFRPEIREELFPIAATAVSGQIDLMMDIGAPPVTYERLEQVVRDAHKEHNFVVQGRDYSRILMQAGPTAFLGRRSRL